jgi:hypothetical protein
MASASRAGATKSITRRTAFGATRTRIFTAVQPGEWGSIRRIVKYEQQ